MEIVPEITAGRRTLGVCVMTIVPLLQLATEYLGTGDRGRAISKLAVTIVGLPILIGGSSAGLRWAAGRRSGPLVLLLGGRLSAGLPPVPGRNTTRRALLGVLGSVKARLGAFGPVVRGSAWVGRTAWTMTRSAFGARATTAVASSDAMAGDGPSTTIATISGFEALARC